jgi:large subunit ribosomal protein L13
MKTFSAKKEEVKRDWYVIDAEGKTLGRLASRIAHRLRGKHKPIFTPHVDTGDFIVVTNAEKIKLTGNKMKNKNYYHYSGYPGGLKVRTAEELLRKKPSELLHHAVKGMLPKNRLGRTLIKKLKVYAGTDHPHQAQQPKPLELKGI